jgi:CheY-like chemotaxis protein
MGGSLVAQSEGLGKGVTMVFTIPLDAAPKRRCSSTTAVAVVDNLWEDAKPSVLLRRLSAPPLRPDGDRSRSPSVATPPDSPASSAAVSAASSSPGGCVVASPSTAAPAAAPAAAPVHHHAESDARAVRVLIAEDDRLCQTLMRKLMPKMGFTATLVDNGASAIEACCSCGPDGGAFVSRFRTHLSVDVTEVFLL